MNLPTLVSFKICPYVLRAVAYMYFKGLNYEIEYIDIANKPEWFMKISPFGKVPLLKIGDQVLFESNVILEYMDEANPPSIQPIDLIIKARNKGFYTLSTDLLATLRLMFFALDKKQFLEAKKNNQLLLDKLNSLISGPYFNGEDIALIDFTFAPVLIQLLHLQRNANYDVFENTHKLKAYSQTITSMESVKKAQVPDFDEIFYKLRAQNNPYYQTLLLKPILYLFNICPYAQRVRTLLEYKGVDYEAKFIDQSNKPQWFMDISPLGKSPCMKIGNRVIFESSAILEYIDEAFEPCLMPQNPLDKADQRAMFAFASDIQQCYHPLAVTKELDDIKPALEKGEKLLQILEDKLQKDSLFFLGNSFTLVDAIFAPVFKGLEIFQRYTKIDFYEKFPKVKLYANNLIQLPAFSASLIQNYDEVLHKLLEQRDVAIIKM